MIQSTDGTVSNAAAVELYISPEAIGCASVKQNNKTITHNIA